MDDCRTSRISSPSQRRRQRRARRLVIHSSSHRRRPRLRTFHLITSQWACKQTHAERRQQLLVHRTGLPLDPLNSRRLPNIRRSFVRSVLSLPFPFLAPLSSAFLLPSPFLKQQSSTSPGDSAASKSFSSRRTVTRCSKQHNHQPSFFAQLFPSSFASSPPWVLIQLSMLMPSLR